MVQFGEKLERYSIPVFNEREVRASAGIYFLILFTALWLIIANQNFILSKYFITFFLVDFSIRLFISPKYSPSLIAGRWIVRNQVPEYVGAPQKKFAWSIGLILSAGMFVHVVIFNTYSFISALFCFTCLIFLFFESAFGICLGCKFYGWIKKDKAQYCPGEVCTRADRHEIQKISKRQLFFVLGLIVFIVIMAIVFQGSFNQQPVEILANS